MTTRFVLFDLDGTLIDSDAALLAPFTTLGVPDDRRPPLGLPLGAACDHAGIEMAAYLAEYDVSLAQPFPGIDDLLAQLDRWAVCSNKQRGSAMHELERLGWTPAQALFSDDFDGRPKELAPLLALLDLEPADAVFIGDTAHDRRCAAEAGVAFGFAGWNPRAVPEPDDLVLASPAEVIRFASAP